MCVHKQIPRFFLHMCVHEHILNSGSRLRRKKETKMDRQRRPWAPKGKSKAVAGSKTLERKGNGKDHIHTECPPTSRPEVSRRETHRGALRRSDVLYHQHRQGDVSGPGRGPETEPARGAEERAVLDLQALVGNQRRSHAVGPLAGAARRANPRTGHWH